MLSRKQKPLVEQALQALQRRDAALFKQALESGLDPNSMVPGWKDKDAHLLTVVASGPFAGREEMVRQLLEHGASIKACRDDGFAILDNALHWENDVYIRLVVSHLDTLYHPSEPTQYAPHVYTPQVLELLVDKGMTKEDVENWGWTAPFDNIPESPEVFAWMVAHGYSLDAPAKQSGKTLLQSLLEDGFGSQAELRVIRALIDLGARVDHLDLPALCNKPHGIGEVAEELVAKRYSALLENATSPATAQRAARRM